MKLRYVLSSALMSLALTATASDYDQQSPFGFCTVASRTDKSVTYDITGGGCYTLPATGVSEDKVITLTATGVDQKTEIYNAISNHSVIIFDGSAGDFIVSSTISFNSIKNKTLIGINNARLCTSWYVTDDIRKALDDAGVPGMSTSGGGGTLPNGTPVAEQAEYNTRLIIMNMYGDKTEAYRNSGIFYFKSCQNLIIRNLSFVGPGSIDVGGSDLVSFYGTKNSWVDHCDFADGMDGNFDITQKSDFNTVSWCIFRYTERAYMHQNTNLVGSSDSEAVGFLNTTYAFNNWSKGCKARMPMARVGKIHMLNNYYDCTGNGSNAINPRKNSEFLIEGNYFEKNVKYYGQSGATAVTWSATNHIEGSSVQPSNVGSTVTVPYDYTEAPVNTVPEMVKTNAGATLTFQESAIEEIPVQRRTSDSYTYNIMGQRVSNDTRGIVIKNGKKYFQR